jgi:hypothetical protein
MNFTDFKKSFFNGRTDKKSLIQQIKIFSNDFTSLNKFINRFERELKGTSGLLKKVLLGNNYLPKSIEQLNTPDRQYFSNSFVQEMNWQAFSFTKCSQLLNKFILLKNEFETCLLLGDYEESRIILEKIEAEICISYWSIEYRFILDEYQFGSEKNWDTRNLVLDNKNNTFVQVLGNMFSLKTEKKVSFFQYNDEFNTWAETEGLKDNEEYAGLLEYFRFKGNYFSDSEYNHLPDLLFNEFTSSIVDRYLTFIRLAQHQVTKTEYNNDIYDALELINKNISDISIKQILLYKTKSFQHTPNEIELSTIKIFDEYTAGNYMHCIELSIKEVSNKNFNNIEILEVYTKSLIEKGLEYKSINSIDNFINEITVNYYNILSKNEKTDTSLVKIVKLAYVFSNSHIGNSLYSFISKQLNWKNETNYAFIENLSSKFINPRLLTNLKPGSEDLLNFSEIINRIYPDSLTVEKFITCNDVNSKIYESFSKKVPQNKTELYQIIELYKSNHISNCISASKDYLKRSDISIISIYEVKSILFSCYLNNQDIRSCLKLFVNTYLKNSHMTKKMDIDELLKSIINSKFKNVGDKKELIELPILLKINNVDKIKVKQAYELFLKSNNFIKPSELFNTNFDIEKYRYFLKNVCSPEILQLSKYFSSSYEVNEERINILKHLSKIDEIEVELYKSEITELTQKNTISKVIGGIDERKIFVNETKIRQNIINSDKQNILQKSNITPLTNESFRRYITLLEFVKNNNEYKDVSSIIQLNEDGEFNVIEPEADKTYQEEDVDVVLYLPAFRIFTTYFLSIRDLFIFSKEFGLNAYLSTRIRHGTLPNHLRSVFETYSLVTAQTDNVYAENVTWKEKLNLSDKEFSKLQIILSEFSLGIDNFSREIKDNYIQCCDENDKNNEKALFDYSYLEQDLILLFLEDFESIRNIDEFIDKSFNQLWNRTENNLKKIREKFDNEYRNKYIELIDTLTSQLNTQLDKQKISELLNNIMTCRTEIQTKLSNISKWFRRSESSFDGEYELSILAETSLQITKNLNPNLNFEIIKDICKSFNIVGDYHQHIIDLINNFMFNFVKHAYLPNDKLDAKLSIHEEDKNIVFNFENNITEETSSKHLNKLKATKDNWENPDSNVNKEGGTGFPKIKKIIHSDLNRHSSEFNYTLDKNKLNIIVSFDIKGLKV